jgi:sRNA-binding protein
MSKMATSKKTTAPKSAEAKVVAPKAEEMTTKVTAAPVEEKKKAGRKPAEKKTETTSTPVTKKVETPSTVKAVKAEAVAPTVNVNIQFAGKSYSQNDFANIAKDIWQYDLGKPLSDLQSVELYVKPEESMAYYVYNGQEQGSFQL